MDYSCIVFDTAPTGHTLRLLQFPTTLQKGLSKLMSLKGMFGGMLTQLSSLLGGGSGDEMQGQLLGKLEQLKVLHPVSICLHRWPHIVGLHVVRLLAALRCKHITQDMLLFERAPRIDNAGDVDHHLIILHTSEICLALIHGRV